MTTGAAGETTRHDCGRCLIHSQPRTHHKAGAMSVEWNKVEGAGRGGARKAPAPRERDGGWAYPQQAGYRWVAGTSAMGLGGVSLLRLERPEFVEPVDPRLAPARPPGRGGPKTRGRGEARDPRQRRHQVPQAAPFSPARRGRGHERRVRVQRARPGPRVVPDAPAVDRAEDRARGGAVPPLAPGAGREVVFDGRHAGIGGMAVTVQEPPFATMALETVNDVSQSVSAGISAWNTATPRGVPAPLSE